MKCPKCGHENPKGVEVCQGCRRVKFVTRKKPGAGGGASPASRPGVAAAPTKRFVPPTDRAARAARPPRAIPPTIEVAPPVGARLALAAAVPVRKHVLERVGAPPVELHPGRPFTIGREETCDLPIPSGRVSRLHAEVRWDDSRPVLVDKGSANGTFVGGKPIKEHPLSSGDEIEVGPFLCVYRHGAAARPAVPAPVKTLIDQGEMLGGQIGEGGLAEVLQGIDFNKKTGTLVVFSGSGQGWITFQNGAPHAAEAGKEHRDLEAVFLLLGITEGRFSFTDELRTPERRIKATTTALLLEWGRRADERERSE